MKNRMEHIALILASNSPRRIALIRAFGLTTAVIPADIDERIDADEAPDAYCDRVAREKFLAVAASLDRSDPCLVLSADTVVIFEGRIFGKPVHSDDARRMLSELSGRKHLVRSSIVVGRWFADGLRWNQSFSETRVLMEALSAEKLNAYVESGDPIGKAGAYAIQNHEFNLIEAWDGCYAGVVGLPLCHADRMLRDALVTPIREIEDACPCRREGYCGLDCDQVKQGMKIERFHVKPSG